MVLRQFGFRVFQLSCAETHIATTYLKSKLIYWWFSVRNTQKQVNVSIRFICHTATDHNPDVWYLSANFVVRIIRRQHAVTLQIRRTLWSQPWRPRLISTRSTLPPRLHPLWLTLDWIVRVPLTPRKLVQRFKQNYKRYDMNTQRRHREQRKHPSKCVIPRSYDLLSLVNLDVI